MGAFVALIGLGISLVASLNDGAAKSGAAKRDAKKAAENAIIARQQGAEDERVFRVGIRKTLAQMNVARGASGIRAGGSAEDYISEAAAEGELDALKIRHGAELKALGFASDSNLANARANAYGTSGYLSASGILLKGGSDFYNKYSTPDPTYAVSGAVTGASIDASNIGIEDY